VAFEDKTVLVTGGARGIGRAIVDHFVTHKARVFVMDVDPSGIIDNEHISTYAGDVSRSADATAFVKLAVKQTGRIDILINNAGIIRDNVIWRMTEEEFDAVLSVNLKGSWLLSREVAGVMREQKSGRIVNIVSRAWLGNFGQSNYSSSKGGLVSLTRVLALELAKYNVTVNAIAPGLIDTPMTKALPPETLKKLIAAQPGRKAGTPEDIAHAVAFLSSSKARFITGQLLHVDGGKSIGATVF
jgi:NAD(P)-dependent dehydrogenase (short-subunit alcohol dehydrogenase family)